MEPKSPAHVVYGTALRRVRIERGLSQERLALVAGLYRSYVSSVERGERNVSLTNLLKLSEALGLRLSELAALAEELMAEETS